LTFSRAVADAARMPGLAALILATPVFGFSLAAPSFDATWLASPDSVVDVAAALPLPELMQLAEASPDDAAQAEEDRRYAEQVRQRQEIGSIHRALGITTWVSMTATLILGMMQYSDLYGFGAGRDQNPCTTGHGVVLDECSGVPWAHAISASTTAALYTVTFTLSLIMPDPNDADAGNGQFAERLRIHEALRWIHLVGMVAQMFLGIGVSNGLFGDRANNYDTQQIVAGVHQAIGWTTWGALTAAGAIMLF
jgi:hypothetical protein